MITKEELEKSVNEISNLFSVSASDWLKGASAKTSTGDSKDNNIVITEVDDEHPQIEKFKPIRTRHTMSKFEYCRVITAAAKYLYNLPNLERFCSTIEVNMIINPAELAFKLLQKGRLNATFDRLGYEKVSYSELRINSEWQKTIEYYFRQKANNEVNEVLKPFGLL